MKNSGLKNEQKVQEILEKGSSVLTQKNSAGVRLFKESDLGDGIIGGKLFRPNYNTDELIKSIDTDIFELLPQEVPELPDTVLRSVYDDALSQIDDLTLEVERLNIEIGELSSKISELEIVSESLKIEADNQILKANISEQQSITANEQVGQTTIDLSNAIQNSINEAVERVSLTARNESLQSTVQSLTRQIDSLNEQLFGRQSAELEGAITTSEIGVKIKAPKETSTKALIYFARLSGGLFSEPDRGWENGPTIEIENFTDEELNVSVRYDDAILNIGQRRERKVKDYLRGGDGKPLPILLPANGTGEMTFTIRKDGVDGGNADKLNSLFATGDRLFKGNIFIDYFSGTTKLGTLTLPIQFRKQSGSKYTGPTS
jgi:hypothetical protein